MDDEEVFGPGTLDGVPAERVRPFADGEGAMHTFEALESCVRSYCRAFPTVFARASGPVMVDEGGREYIDFFSGAGTLNYGHNPQKLKQRLVEYLAGDGILHSLDMATVAKREFLQRFDSVILRPRGMEYRVQFPGPTGTNAVEAALKLARKVTRRSTVACFANSFHGMTLGSLAVSGNLAKRSGAGVALQNSVFLPFDGDLGPGHDTLDHFESILRNPGSGVEVPAAVIVETIQAEGGVKVAGVEWLRRLEALAREHRIVLIVDDIQVGCGRTGTFFSFEAAGIRPDIVCLSKALSGLGLPMSLVLIRPELDVWEPGEHNGTFRGNNLAFVTATEALAYWETDELARAVADKAERVSRSLEGIAARHPHARASVRGRGLIQGLLFGVPDLASRVARAAFARGLVIETAGPRGEMLKLLPPLTISTEVLDEGLHRIEQSLEDALAGAEPRAPAAVS